MRRLSFYATTFILSCFLFTLVHCGLTNNSSTGDRLTQALELAGENRIELEKVLNHYQVENDTLKLKLARYLISNMDGHSYVTYRLIDTLENEVDFDPISFASYADLLAGFDSLEDHYGTLDYERNEKTEDLQTVTADFLIEHIDWAVRAWRERPWAKALSYDDFCNYVLPYRGSNEPLERWRKPLWEKYNELAGEEPLLEDPIEAARLINQDIKTWFGFDERYYYHPTDQGYEEMTKSKIGRCEDMTNITIYAMRANGLAVTSDYTPYWANSGNNHAWNAIVTQEGKAIPFMGAEADPGKYRLWNKLAKVYRKTYAIQHDNLTFQIGEDEKPPRWLAGKNYLDVTSDYVEVSDVAIELARSVPEGLHYGYLCVFNSGEFKAIHWSEINNDSLLFTDMGRDICYLPTYYDGEELIPAADLFILTESGSLRFWSGADSVQTLTLVSTTKATIEYSTEGIAKSRLKIGSEYELFYWEDEWKSLGKQVASEKPLVFGEVPANRLYWLVETDSRREERIFSSENGQQIWW